MIDPDDVTNFHRTEEQLEEFLLFCIVVAGKNSRVQANKLHDFLHKQINTYSPFDWINRLDSTMAFSLVEEIQKVKLGQYRRLTDAFRGVLKFKGRLKKVTLEELESVSGIGQKTSRFFLTHTRPNQKFAVLDTHLLSHMREDLGIDTPKLTPSSSRKYLELEQKLLAVIEKSGKSYAQYDLDIWKSRRK